MIAFLLSLALAQAPAAHRSAGVVVLISRQSGLSALEADGIAERVAAALSAANVPLAMSPAEVREQLGRSRPLKCVGKPLCVAAAGRDVGAAAAVGVEAANIFGELGVKLYVITTDGTAPVVEDTVVVSPGTSELDTALASFADRVHAALSVFPAFAPPKPPPPPIAVKPPSDVPRVQPPPRSPGLVPAPALTPAKRGGPPAMAYVAGGGAVASAAAAGVLGYFAYHAYGQLVLTDPSSPYGGGTRLSGLKYSEYQAMQTNAVVAGIAGGACVALTSAAIYLFMQGGPPAR